MYTFICQLLPPLWRPCCLLCLPFVSSHLVCTSVHPPFPSSSYPSRLCAKQEAAAEYVELMKTQAGVDKVPAISVESAPAKCLSASW